MELSDFWDDPKEIGGNSGRKYFRLATITWSRPRLWHPDQRKFDVPKNWAGHGGVYALIRAHWKQNDQKRIAYIGKALSFGKRLTDRHQHFDLVTKRGDTSVSCGRIAFERVRANPGYYLEIEDIIKFCVYEHLENKQGFESLPGFRKNQPRAMVPWIIENRGHRFGIIPKRIVYPWIAVDF